jgi:hypothetical protein
MKKIPNLDEKIFVFCYPEKKYHTEIIKQIYATEHPSQSMISMISRKVKELIDIGWLEQVSGDAFIDDNEDKRQVRRKYVISTSKPIIDYISNKVILSSEDKSSLSVMFNRDSIRKIFSIGKRGNTIEGLVSTISILSLASSMTYGYLSHYYPHLRNLPRKNLWKEIKKK